MKDDLKVVIKLMVVFAIAVLVGSYVILNSSAVGDTVIDQSYECFYECDDDIYHVGDVFESRTKCFITLCTTVLHSDGVVKNHYDTFDITCGFTSSYDGVLLEHPGEYIETLSGEDGILRHPFYVYEYGDLNGDYKVTMSDVIGMYRVIAEDPDYNTEYIFNADMNNDDNIDLFDAVVITRKLNDLFIE